MKIYLASLVSFLILDGIWLGLVMKNFNLRQLSEIGRIENGSFQILYIPALLTYFLMAAAISFFVIPKIESSDAWLTIFGWGALMGLVVYGIFDLTNLAILKNYPMPFVFADIAWGVFVFGAVTLIVKKFAVNQIEL